MDREAQTIPDYTIEKYENKYQIKLTVKEQVGHLTLQF